VKFIAREVTMKLKTSSTNSIRTLSYFSCLFCNFQRRNFCIP